MLEIPESYNIAKQLNDTIKNKVITKVIANASPHKFAWFFNNNPSDYEQKLINKVVGSTTAYGGQVEITVQDCKILFGDGVNIRYYQNKENALNKHQLYIEFNDNSCLVGTVAMYGGLWVYYQGENSNPYYIVSVNKPSPLSADFNEHYFNKLVSEYTTTNLSLKAFLATEQRIPGLGNGVLQDILFNAKFNPRYKLKYLTQEGIKTLFDALKSTLIKMKEQGGRDTEKDIFGFEGGYKTILSSKTNNQPCSICGTIIKKEAYLGGSIYYCENCQKLKE